MNKFSAFMGQPLEADIESALKLNKFIEMTSSFEDEIPLLIDYTWASNIEAKCTNELGGAFWLEISGRASRKIYSLGSLRRKYLMGADQPLLAVKPSKIEQRSFKIPIISWDHDDTGIHLLADNS